MGECMKHFIIFIMIVFLSDLHAGPFDTLRSERDGEKAPNPVDSGRVPLEDPNANTGMVSSASPVMNACTSFSLPIEIMEAVRVHENLTFRVDGGNLVIGDLKYQPCFVQHINFVAMQVDEDIVVKGEPVCQIGSDCNADPGGRLNQLLSCIDEAASNEASPNNQADRIIIPLETEENNVRRSGEVRWGFAGNRREFNNTFLDSGISISENAYPTRPVSDGNRCLHLRSFDGNPRYATRRDRRLQQVNEICANGTIQDILSAAHDENEASIRRVLERGAIESVSEQMTNYARLVGELSEDPNAVRALTSELEYSGMFTNIRNLLMGDSANGRNGLIGRLFQIKNRIRQLARENNSDFAVELQQLRSEEQRINQFLDQVRGTFGNQGNSLVEQHLVRLGLFEEAAMAKSAFFLAETARQAFANPNRPVSLSGLISTARTNALSWENRVLNPRIEQHRRQQHFNSIVENIGSFGPDGNFESPGIQQQLIMNQIALQNAQRDYQRDQISYYQNLARICNDTISAGPIQLSGLRSFTPGQRRGRAQRCLNEQRRIMQHNNAAQMDMRNQQMRLQRLQEYLQFVRQAEQQGINQYNATQAAAAQANGVPFTLPPSEQLNSQFINQQNYYNQFGPTPSGYNAFSNPFNMDVQMSGMPYAQNPQYNPFAPNGITSGAPGTSPNFNGGFQVTQEACNQALAQMQANPGAMGPGGMLMQCAQQFGPQYSQVGSPQFNGQQFNGGLGPMAGASGAPSPEFYNSLYSSPSTMQMSNFNPFNPTYMTSPTTSPVLYQNPNFMVPGSTNFGTAVAPTSGRYPAIVNPALYNGNL